MLPMMQRRNDFGMSLFDDMSRMFDSPFFRQARRPQTMKTDIREEDGLYLMTMDLPGYDKKDIRAELKNGYLTISAEKNDTHEESSKDGYVVRERSCGSCSRSFYVGDHVTQDDIKAAYKDGTLNLSFPKEAAQAIEGSSFIAIE